MTLSPVRVVIVEDQPNIRADIQYLVERQNGFTISGACGTVREARKLIHSSKADLLLLDINLPDGSGFDILKDVPGEFKVIFLTAFEEHAIKAIKFGALDYLLKPINEKEFSEALSKASHFLSTKKEQLHIASGYHYEGVRNRLVLRSQDYLQIIEISQIVYCNSNAGYTTFHLNDGRKLTVSKILKDYEDILTEPAFLRPHQSYLINSNYIDGYSKEGIHLKGGEQIPVSNRRKDVIMEFFNRM